MENILQGPMGFNLPDIGFGEFVFNKLCNTPERNVQIDAKSGEVLTNHDLLKRSVALARELEKKNIKFGDTIAISCENSTNYFVGVCGTIYTGATISPMNPAYLEDEIRHCLNISKPKIIFVSRLTEGLIHKVVKKLPWKIELIQLDNETSLKDVNTLYNIITNNNNNKATMDNDPSHYKPAKISQPDKQEVVILYSSGTTGLPKGVMLSHRNLLALWYAHVHTMFPKSRQSVYLMFLPFFHGYGFSLMLLIATVGAKAIVMKSFEPELFCKSIETYKVTTLLLVPPIMIFLAKHPMIAKYDFDSVVEIICGAAPLSTDVHKAVNRRLGNKSVIRNGYGMTETTVVVTICQPNSERIGTIGSLLPGVDCKIVDTETWKTLGVGKVGEMCFAGDFNMLGYKNDPEATKQTIDNDGWLHTGDLGYYDRHGDLYIVGRLKELIKTNGFQIAPAEIENLLLRHEDVYDAAVHGQEDETCGQIPVAFVVLKPNAKVTPQELCKFVNERVSPQKRLRGGVKIVKSIPKNASGKILRRKLHTLVSKL